MTDDAEARELKIEQFIVRHVLGAGAGGFRGVSELLLAILRRVPGCSVAEVASGWSRAMHATRPPVERVADRSQAKHH